MLVSAAAWIRSTTSVPDVPASDDCGTYQSTRSRSTAPSSKRWAATPIRRRSCGRSSRSPGAWACGWWRRGWRRRRSPPSSRPRAATRRRAATLPCRCRLPTSPPLLRGYDRRLPLAGRGHLSLVAERGGLREARRRRQSRTLRVQPEGDTASAPFYGSAVVNLDGGSLAPPPPAVLCAVTDSLGRIAIDRRYVEPSPSTTRRNGVRQRRDRAVGC